MKEFLSKLLDYGISIGGKLLLAIVVLIVGCLIIKGVILTLRFRSRKWLNTVITGL